MADKKDEIRETGARPASEIPEGSQANPADAGVEEGDKRQVARKAFDPDELQSGTERNPADVAGEKGKGK